MNTHRSKMDQRIFKEGLTTESISCYLLCCGLSDAGDVISRQNLSGIWNGDEASLDSCLGDLENRDIIRRITGSEDGPCYRLTHSAQWKATPSASCASPRS